MRSRSDLHVVINATSNVHITLSVSRLSAHNLYHVLQASSVTLAHLDGHQLLLVHTLPDSVNLYRTFCYILLSFFQYTLHKTVSELEMCELKQELFCWTFQAQYTCNKLILEALKKVKDGTPRQPPSHLPQ